MAVDILAIGENRRKRQEDTNVSIMQPAWIQKERYYAQMMDEPQTKITVNPLDRQVEIGLGTRLTPMSRQQKQEYADGLPESKWSLMQRYKAEGYSFEASKQLVENQKKLLQPLARGVNKYKDYEAKEQYYNQNGVPMDENMGRAKTLLYSTHPELMAPQLTAPAVSLLKSWAKKYEDWATNEVNALAYTKEQGENSWKDWIADTLVKGGLGLSQGIQKTAEAFEGAKNIEESGIQALLDRAILGYDTDLDFYKQTDRRLDEYLWEGISGGATTYFWIAGLPVMLGLTALGNTELGGEALDKLDTGLGTVLNAIFDNTPGIRQYYRSLDDQGKEDMVDSIKDAVYYRVAKQTGKGVGKLKTNTTVGRRITNIENAIKNSLKQGVKEGKEQIKKEVDNVKESTDLYDEEGKKTGKMGPEGEVGIGKSVSRIIDSAVKGFREQFKNDARARIVEPGETGAETPETPTTETPGKPNDQKGVIDKVKDTAQSTVDTIKTGLTPEERARIQNDPFVSEKFNKAMAMINEAGMPLEESLVTEQLYNEIGDKIMQVFDEWEKKLSETSPYYQGLRELTNTYSLVESLPGLTDLLLKNDITTDPFTGELNFNNSKFVSDADMRSVQRAVDMVRNTIINPLTPRDYLNLRAKLDQLAKYTTVDASRGQSLIRQIRHVVDGIAKKTIPGLKEIDDTTAKYFKEISELKDGWVYKGGDRKGEIRNNFYSIIKNLTGHNRKVMLQRLEKYYPGVTEEIEAIHLTSKLVKAYNKAPQMIKSLGLGGGLGGAIMGGNLVSALIGAIIGEMVQKGLIEPGTKKRRRNAIDKLLSEMSPEARAKLEEIARRQTYAKEISEEDQKILEGVAEIIRQERDRGLSEEAIKEREKRTKKIDNALPGIQPDVIDENGNITLGRGNVISPEKGPGRARRLTRVNEINLKNPETTPDKQVLDLQEKLDVDTDTAQEIQNRMDEFLTEIGANEEGTVGGREVNYEKFTTRSLEQLMDNDNLPRTEKDKIEDILARRGAEQEAMNEVKAERDFATRIKKLQEEEQRIGKVGKNKVSKEVADKQMREREKKREALIKEIQDYYGIDQFEASDKYLDMEAKGDQYIREYKRSNAYKTETAEREVLDSLMQGWSKQPKFVRDMNEGQLTMRQDLLNNVELQNGYKLETTNYNDRYILEDNGNIVDRGAIKYNEDGTIEITAQSFDGIKESGLLRYLPDSTIIKETGSDTWMSAKELKQYPKADRFRLKDDEGALRPAYKLQQYYDFEDKNPIEKFTGELTEEQKQEGLDLYELAKEPLSKETEKDIIEARGKFLVLNQKPGYTKSLGLDQGDVNKTIMSWQWMSPELKTFVDKIHAKTDPKYWFMGMSNWIERDNPWRGTDALKFLTDEVKGVDKDPAEKSYELEIRSTLDGIMLGNSKLSYDTLKIRLTHGEEMNAFNLELMKQEANGEYFPDIDMLVAGEGTETVIHEEGHYISTLIGREMLGTDRKFDKGIRYATSDFWKKFSPERYKSPEVATFHQKILDLVKSLDKSMEPWMKVDNRIVDGKVMKDYRADADEKRARFWQGSIEFTKRIATTGKLPAKTYRSEHGDRYTLKQYEQLLDILQEHQRLADEGLFYEVEVPDLSGENRRTGLKDIQQQSLFDEGEPSNEEIGNFIVDEYPKINSRIQPLAERNGYTMEAFARRLDAAYDPDIETWRKALKDEEIDLTPEELVMITDTIKTMVNDPKTEKIISKIQQGPIKAFRRLLERMKENPLNVPESMKGLSRVNKQQKFTELEKYMNGLSNSDKWTDTEKLTSTYDPDIMEWMDNIKTNYPSTDIKINDLYKLQGMIEKHIEQRGYDVNEDVIASPQLKVLLKDIEKMKIKKQIGTYDRKQIEKVGFETNKLIENRIKDIKMYYENINPDWKGFDEEGKKEAIERKELLEDEFHDFEPDYIYAIGKTYDPDIDKWHNNIKEWLKDNLKKYEGFVGVSAKQIGDIILPHQLNSLKSKINELEKYSYEDIFNAFEGQEAEVFFRAVKPRIEEIQAKGVEKAVTNLVALSNVEEENFRKLIENFNGKDPMPSIAVMDVNVPHEVFGDITLVFGRDTVDPKVDERNKIYGSDAWTPTFPSLKEVRKSGKRGLLALHEAFDSDLMEKEFTEIMSEFGIPEGKEGIIWSLANDVNYFRLDLQNLSGKELRDKIDQLANKIARINFKGNSLFWYGPEPTNAIQYQWYEKNAVYNKIVDKIKEIYTEASNDTELVIPASYFEFDTAKKEENIRRIAEDVTEYLKNDPKADYIGGFYDEGPEGERKLLEDITRFVEDRWDDGTETIIDKLVMEYGADEDVLRDIVEKYYLPEGDRPLTPENVLEAMRNQRTRRETFPGEYEDMIEIEGTELNDIEDVRRQNFAKVFHGDRTGEFGDLKDRYNRLIDMIREYISDPDMIETVPDNVLKTAVKVNYDADVNKFKENMEGEGQISDVPTDILQRIIDVVEQGKKIPIRFSESKPERIVNLMEEVRYILAPEGADASQVKSIVRGTPLEGKVVEYKPDNRSAPRSRKLKELQKKYGNVFFNMGGVIMPIAMLYLMMEQEEGQA